MTRTRRRRIVAVSLTVAAVLGLLAAAVLLRMHAAPEPARLLPECDGIFYVDLRPIRQFTNLGKKQISTAPEYRKFVEQTGFEVGRDLDEVAFAMHAPPDAQHETRYTEVVVGKFNSTKLADFLSRNARSRETYLNHEIFLIPFEDRIIRVTVLSLDMVAVSNTGDRAQIDHIIDEFRRSAFASGGPSLLAKYYRDVPLGSLSWLITDVAPPSAAGLADNAGVLSFVRQLWGGGVVVGSGRYNGYVLLRADDFLQSESAAKDRAEQLGNLLALYRTTESQTRPAHPDPDMESALDSLKVEQKGSRVQVSASVPRALLEKMFVEPAEAPPAGPTPNAGPKAKRGKRR